MFLFGAVEEFALLAFALADAGIELILELTYAYLLFRLVGNFGCCCTATAE